MLTESLELKKLLDKVKGAKKTRYDCIVPISGGKDGSYILWYLKKYTSLNVLAYHIDNFYIADGARKNVENITKKLGCALEVYRPNWKTMQELYKKLILQMGEMCIACEMILLLGVVEFAIDKNVPYIIWGSTPNQLKSNNVTKGYRKHNLEFYSELYAHYEQLISSTYRDNPTKSEEIIRHLIKNDNIDINTLFPTSIYPFYYLGYDADTIERTLSCELNWKRDKNTAGTSSNCLINQVNIALKKKIQGVEKFKKRIEKKMLSGEATNEVFTKASSNSENVMIAENILKELGIDESLEKIVSKVNNYEKDEYLLKESDISH